MQTEKVIVALTALAQQSRLSIFRHLVQAGPAGAFAGQIADRLSIPAATLSFHMKELSHAGLVERESAGTFVRYTAKYAAMNDLIGYLTENCCGGDPSKCAPKTKSKVKKK